MIRIPKISLNREKLMISQSILLNCAFSTELFRIILIISLSLIFILQIKYYIYLIK